MTAPAYTVRVRGGLARTAREYHCPDCAETFDDTVPSPPPDTIECPVCSGPSHRIMSAPAVHVTFAVTASRGANDAKPHPMAMDTRPLAEGQPLREWKKERAKLWGQYRRKQVKELLE